MPTMTLNRLHFPVTVLGPGRRVGIWFQGCSIGCAGCMSLDTWATRGVEEIDVDRLLAWLSTVPADGVTISGGEPTQQPDALRALLDGLQRWRGNSARDVLLFTGRSPDWARGEGADLLAGADAVVAGPFVAEQAGATALRGSENQELLLLTELGRQAYADLDAFPRADLQLAADADALWVIGIPLPGGLAALAAADADANADAVGEVPDADVVMRRGAARRSWR